MKKDEILEIKKWIILILIAVFSYWGLNNLNIITGLLNKLFNVLFPFILGGVIAFILNIPMSKIENILTKKIKNNKKKKLIRTLSIILSLLILVVIILFAALLLIPELVENIKMLIDNIPGIIDKLEVFIMDLLDKYPSVQGQIQEVFEGSGNVTNVVSNILNYFINGAVGFISSLVSGFITIFTAIIFSIYMLSSKEYLIRGSKKVLFASLGEKKTNKVIEVLKLANNTFSKFISGQCLDAVILGIIMFIAFTLFKFPYALIISVLTTITALIPVFGAIIAMVIGAILIAITNPVKAVIFIIVFQVIQQIEGNLIYPKVVGKSVGLSPLWTLFAITIGGNLFGVVGMLVELPFASVVYAIIKEVVNDKLIERKINVQ